MKTITRRVFLKQTIIGAGGLVLAKSFGDHISIAQMPPDDISRVIVASHPGATDGVKTINSDNVQIMMDESIKHFTNSQSVADAWSSILPNFKKENIIAIKVNALQKCPTSPEVVNAVVNGLISAGAKENNIIIWDRANHELKLAGYKYNKSDTGVRCFGTDEEEWGYDLNNPVEILNQKKTLSNILTRCDHLINIPVLKVHLDPYGVTLSLKNHYGSVDNPQTLHDNFATVCAILNNQNAIRNKTRLIVIDAVFGFWGSNTTTFVRDFCPNSLIMSKDPVAADYIGTEMLNEELANHNFPPRNVPLLAKATEMGLGTNDPAKIELIKLELKNE